MKIKYASIDIESTGLSRYKDDITYIGIGIAEDIGKPLKKMYVYRAPFEGDTLKRLTNNINKLREHRVKCIWQNGKFDTLFIEHKLGIKLPISHDIMIMGTAYDLASPHGLKYMAQKYLGVTDWDVDKKTKTKQSEETEQYLKYDIHYTWELFCYFNTRMNELHWKIYDELLRPAFLMYRNVERNGIFFDKEKHKRVKKEYTDSMNSALAELKVHHDINWNSPKQVQEALFTVDKLPTIKLSQKTGAPSADAKVLRRLAAQGHILPSLLLTYKFYYGAMTKFLTKWTTYASYDGRIHPSFNLTNVVTGRTSCSDPNLQQVPRNPELRSLFTSAPERVLIEADYSQIELRIAADYANETNMIKIFKTGGDIHTETAKIITGKQAPTSEDRSRAKAVNFGFLYGMQWKKFMDYAFDSYGVVVKPDEAKRFRELFFIKYPGLLLWHKRMEAECEMLGGISNRFGRFRALPDIYSSSFGERNHAVRQAINTPVQGTASDLLIASATEIDRKLSKQYNLMVVGTIHDSLLIDCSEEYVEDAMKHIRYIMTHPQVMDMFDVSFKVPIEVDVGVGAWGNK